MDCSLDLSGEAGLRQEDFPWFRIVLERWKIRFPEHFGRSEVCRKGLYPFWGKGGLKLGKGERGIVAGLAGGCGFVQMHIE